MGRRGGFLGSFATGLAGGLAESTKDLGKRLVESRRYADALEREKQREAVRVAERKELMDIQAANQKAGQRDRRLGMMLNTLDPSVRGEGYLLSQQGDDALTAGMPGLIDEGRRLAREAEGRAFWKAKELAKMRRGRFADASRKAPYASFQNATRTLEGISKKLLQDAKSINKQLENTLLLDKDKAALQSQRDAITDRLKEANNSRMYNASLMSRAITGDVPSRDEFSIGVKMFLQSQGLNHQNPEVFDNSALTLLYARYRPEMIAAEKQPAVREQKQDNQPAFNYRWREPK